MKLLYLSDRLSTYGGADHHLHQVIGWALENGNAVTLAHGRVEGPPPDLPGCRIERIRGLSHQVQSSSRLRGLSELITSHDRVHVQNIMNPEVLAMAAGSGKAIITIQDHRMFCPGPGKTLPDGRRCTDRACDATCRVCLDDDDYRRRLLDLMDARRQALDGCALIVLSHYMAGEMAAAGCPDAQVIPPWIDCSQDEPQTGSGFLCGGRLVRHKAQVVAWRAWKKAALDQPLRVAGRGEMGEELEDAHLLGWLDQSRLRSEMSAARAVVFTALWQEPFGIFGAQALACGTPVILAAGGGVDEWAVAGCLRCHAGDTNEIASAMKRLADDPELAIRLGAQGRKFIRQRFSRHKIEGLLRSTYGMVD